MHFMALDTITEYKDIIVALPFKPSAVFVALLLGTALGGCLYLLYDHTSRHGLPSLTSPDPVTRNARDGIASYFVPPPSVPHPKANTLSAAFLSSLFAQRHQRWKDAARYIHDLRSFQDEADHPTILKQAIILEMSANTPEAAIQAAKHFLKTAPADDASSLALARLLLAAQAIRDRDYAAAYDHTNGMVGDGLALFLRPLIRGWLNAEDDTFDENLADGHSTHMLAAAYIADYLGERKRTKRVLDSIAAYDDIPLADQEQLADLYHVNGFKDTATQIYERLLTLAPTSERLQKKVDTKDNDLPPDLLLHKRPQSVQHGVALSLYTMANMLADDGTYDSARLFINLALYLAPDLNEASLLKASIAAHFGHYEDALRIYKHVDKNSPYFTQAQHQAASIYASINDTSSAVALLDAHYTDTNSLQTLLQIGHIQRRGGLFQDALKSYDKAINSHLNGTITQEFWHLHYVRGMVLEQLGQWEDAKTDLEHALTYYPENPLVLNYLGYAMADRGEELDRALDMLEKALSLEPHDGSITDSVGWAYFKLARYEKALPYLERAAELMPGDAIINDHLGDVYWHVGRRIEARYQWKRALTADDLLPALKASLTDKLNRGLKDEPALDKTTQGSLAEMPDNDISTAHTDQN